MKPGLWIAQRFSFARKRFRIINIISTISLAGIIVGVSTLLVVMSVLNGFQKLARDLFITIDSSVQIVPFDGGTIKVSENILRALRALDSVGSAEPFAEGEAVLSSKDKSELVFVKGFTESAHRRMMRQAHLHNPLFTAETISVGEILAYRTNLYPSMSVRIFTPELISLGLESLSQPDLIPALSIPETTVASLFSMQKLFDDHYVLTSDRFAQRILLFGRGEYSGIDIREKAGTSSQMLSSRLKAWLAQSSLKKTCRVQTLEEKYHNIFAVMQLEKWVSFSVLMLIILVAALSLTGSLAMTAIDKQQELFYLRCLGLDKTEFMAIFIVQGGMTGCAGTVAGAVIAWIICKCQELYGFVRLPSKSAFIIDSYPVQMQFSDFIAVSITAIMLCLAVSLYPARKAALIAESSSLDSKTN